MCIRDSSAVILIQAFARGRRYRRLLEIANEHVRQSVYALIIQRMWRGHMGRIKYQACRNERNRKDMANAAAEATAAAEDEAVEGKAQLTTDVEQEQKPNEEANVSQSIKAVMHDEGTSTDFEATVTSTDLEANVHQSIKFVEIHGTGTSTELSRALSQLLQGIVDDTKTHLCVNSMSRLTVAQRQEQVTMAIVALSTSRQSPDRL